jgi:hypothetical protein
MPLFGAVCPLRLSLLLSPRSLLLLLLSLVHATHNISPFLEKQLVHEPKRWVELAELINGDPCCIG